MTEKRLTDGKTWLRKENKQVNAKGMTDVEAEKEP